MRSCCCHESETGRYLTPDPIGLVGGLNLYGYANANPVMEVDPLGLESGPYHPPEGVKVKCVNTDTCPQLTGKMGQIMKMIKSHEGWDRNNPPPRGGGRHSQEIAELWSAYANCQSIYKTKKCDEDKCKDDNCTEKLVPVAVGVGAGAYLMWKVVKTCGCAALGGPAAGAACALTP